MASEIVITESEDDYLLMSGIQHFCFCRRQWALIHIEQQWEENVLTAEGRIDHQKCHDENSIEKRADLIIMRGMRVVSHKLRLSGACDVVEFHRDDEGIPITRYEGKWSIVPIEYKHGKAKTIDADRLQLCAQGIALEEMFVTSIEFGYLFYKETNKREEVEFSEELRNKTENMAAEMYQYYSRGWTPSVRKSAKCKSCSLNEICLPDIMSKHDVIAYIHEYVE